MRRVVGVLACCCYAITMHAQTPVAAGSALSAFNQALKSATQSMNPAATLALWEDDGVSLLPSTPPIVGKRAITAFFNDVMKQLAGAHMDHFDLWCYDAEIAGLLASEWCVEHQIVILPAGKPPFDGWGKMLLTLHRGSDGQWRIAREMWNQASAGDSLPPPH